MRTSVSSVSRTVIIGDDSPTVLIGERINPTGKKEMAEALGTGDLRFVQGEAVSQAESGADIIDVNCGIPGADETALLPEVIMAVMEVVDLPLCIDSSDPKALAAALSVTKGKPIINSVTGEERSLETVLPLVKEHGTAVIGLTMDESGIPSDPDQRLSIAARIVERAEKLGISRDDIIIDCLVTTIGVDSKAAMVTVESIRKVKEALDVNLTMGGSNISMGLPDRDLINGAFLAMAILEGVTCPIVDAAKMRPIILSLDLLMGRDSYAARYIKAYRQRTGK